MNLKKEEVILNGKCKKKGVFFLNKKQTRNRTFLCWIILVVFFILSKDLKENWSKDFLALIDNRCSR